MAPTRTFTIDPANPPRLTDAQRKRLDAMTDAEITAAAESDPDTPSPTGVMLDWIELAARIKRIRATQGLTQAEFAELYGFPAATLREWEQGRRRPDRAVLAYLRVIEHEPEAVRRALDTAAQ